MPRTASRQHTSTILHVFKPHPRFDHLPDHSILRIQEKWSSGFVRQDARGEKDPRRTDDQPRMEQRRPDRAQGFGHSGRHPLHWKVAG
jgi:hypothetical protein